LAIRRTHPPGPRRGAASTANVILAARSRSSNEYFLCPTAMIFPVITAFTKPRVVHVLLELLKQKQERLGRGLAGIERTLKG